MSRLPRADGAADADLARALEHAREHDVHDPDAADEQRDRRERDHDEAEDALRPPLLREQLRRYDQREVVGVAVRGIEDAAHHVGRRTTSVVDASCR